jgi:hypothetical protein
MRSSFVMAVGTDCGRAPDVRRPRPVIGPTNDGRSFSHENSYAICSFRECDKASQQRGLQIGKFGVGFKSVFRVSRSPHIITWDESAGEPLAFRFFVPGAIDREYHRTLEAQCPFHYSPKVPESERADFPSRIGYLFPVPVPVEGDLRATWEEQGCGAPGARCSSSPCVPT